MTDFSPERYAFRFRNAFKNAVWSGRIPPVIGRKYHLTTSGRCGGMAFASLDFFHLRTPVPTLDAKAFSPSEVPPDGHPLADYIYSRQLHSMLTKIGGARDGLRFLHWSGLSSAALRAKTTGEEHQIVAALDRGQPVVLGLVQATSRSLRAQGVNHQVVCYGYRTTARGDLEFNIYDPNEPFQTSSNGDYSVILRRADDFERSEFPYQVSRPGRLDQWRGFFVMHYRPHHPPNDVLYL